MNAARVWPIALIGVLALTVALNVGVWIRANEPGAASVEPDYYRRAVAWDTTQAEASRSAALGWTARAALSGPTAASTLSIALRDRAGRPLDGARVEATLIHNLDADHPVSLWLAGRRAGLYAAPVRLSHPGLWEVRVAADVGTDRFVADLDAEAPGAGAAR